VKKNDRIVSKDFIGKIEKRNKIIQQIPNKVVQEDFEGYSDELISRLWEYAKLSGIKEYTW